MDTKPDADKLVEKWRKANPVKPISDWEAGRHWRRPSGETLDQEDIKTLREWGII